MNSTGIWVRGRLFEAHTWRHEAHLDGPNIVSMFVPCHGLPADFSMAAISNEITLRGDKVATQGICECRQSESVLEVVFVLLEDDWARAGTRRPAAPRARGIALGGLAAEPL